MSEETDGKSKKMMYFALKISMRRPDAYGPGQCAGRIARISKYSVIDCELVAAVLGFDMDVEDCEQKGDTECTIKE